MLNQEPVKLFQDGFDVLPECDVSEMVGCSLLDIYTFLDVSEGKTTKRQSSSLEVIKKRISISAVVEECEG